MNITAKTQQNSGSVRRMTYTAMLGAIAAALMYLELPLPFMPPFLKLDLSGVPVLVASLIFGPVQGVSVALIKDFVHLLSTQTGGVGELADFIIMGVMAFSVGSVYRVMPDKYRTFAANTVGIMCMTIAGALANKYILIPFYSGIMPIEAIISACNAVNPMIDGLDAYILFGAVPFNLIKGLILALSTSFLYNRLRPVTSSAF